MIGQTLSRYKIGEEIGRGGMGVVYKAHDLRLNRPVAIKVLSPDKLCDADSRRRLVHEARAASALNHPNIIIVHDIDECSGVDFIAMEYVSGQSLERLISAGGLPLDQALDYGIKIASAIAAAHGAGIVHRDLKPANVVIGAAGLVKVLDFGLAKSTQRASGADEPTMTLDPAFAGNEFCGTPAYMAPEQIDGKAADERSDVFAFGALLYEMVTGRAAYRRNTLAATAASILSEEPEAARRLKPGIPIGLDSLIAGCLKKEPCRRTQRIQDVAAAIEQLKRQFVSGGTERTPRREEDEPMTRILIVEDEPGISMLLEDDLRLEGYYTEVATDGEIASRRAREEAFDLILLDVMLPHKSGFDVCREVRHAGVRTPILLLTAKAQEAEKVMGLDLGADDYVTKPFSPHELRARIRALLRRRESGADHCCSFGDVEVDFTRSEVKRGGRHVETTALEFKLIATFLKNRGRLLSRGQLLDEVWGHGVAVTDRVVDNQILSIRRKIEPEPSQPRYLVSVRGMGYRFEG